MSDAARFNPADEAVRFLAAIVESSDDAIIGKDLNGVIVTWNRAAERLYGYAASEVVGRSISVLIPADHADELEGILSRIRSGQRVFTFETVRRTKEGQLVEVSLSVSPIADGSGAVVGAATIARDLTRRKQTEAALRDVELRWKSVVDSAVDGIVVIDERGRIEGFNRAAERLFGYQESEMIGENVSLLMPSPDREAHDEYLARYLTTGLAKIIGIGREVTGLRRDGSTFPIHLSVGEIPPGEALADGSNPGRHFTGILHDLTARVRIEEQLRAQSTLASLGEMAAVIAHEVKNPLAGIRGAVQVIGGRLPADSRDALVMKEIVARVDGLNALMKDLLLFARTPQPKLAPVELPDLLKTTAELLSADPLFGGVRLEIEGTAPPVAADADLLKIVFVNLFVNSAHAVQGQGAIRVSIAAAAEACDVFVHDSGPGIPPEIREKIFTPFFTTKARGSGLGLPTAKRLIDVQGGSIRIDCPPEGGTIVTVRLPLNS